MHWLYAHPGRFTLLLALAAGCFDFSPSLGAATVEGTVDLGPAPKQPRLHKRYGGSASHPGMPQAPVAVVYLESAALQSSLKPPEEPVEMLQKDLQFKPAVLPIVVGATVEFPNDDATYHNVFSYSPTKRFDLGRYRGREDVPSVTFDEPGVVKVFCEVHNHMRGTILVLETPVFTVTDAEGKFSLPDVPAGSYTLKAWVNDKTTYTQTINVAEDETLTVDLEGK